MLTILAPEGEELGVGATLGKIAVIEGSELQAIAKKDAQAGAAQEKIVANGIHLAVQRSGSGTPLVLIHGDTSQVAYPVAALTL